MSQYDLSRPVVARVRDAIDIVTLVGEVVTLRKSGRNFMGLCPFHGEKTPSFSVSREKGTYYCFGCKRGGDAIDFVMELERLSFAEAVERLAARFGVDLPFASPESKRRRDERDSLQVALDAAQAFFARRVGEDRPRAALERRGVSLEEASHFGLGYAPAEWRALYDELRRRFPERDLAAAGLIVEGEGGRFWDRFRDRITIPIRSPRGSVIAFGGRAVGDETPKYLNSPETALFSKSTVLYCLDRALPAFSDANRAIVVEGYFDCIALQNEGFHETVATLGTSLSEHHARELARRVGRVMVCFDGDVAGRSAAVAALRTLLAADLEADVLLLPEGQDPDDVVRRGGRAGVERLLHEASSATTFLIGQMGASRDERRRNLLISIEIVNVCPDPVRRYAMREALAASAGVPVEALGALASPRVLIGGGPTSDLPPAGELALLRGLFLDVPLPRRGELLNQVVLEAIDHPITKLLLEQAKGLVESGQALEISEIATDIYDREARRVLAALEHEVPPCAEEHLTLVMRELCEKQRGRRLAQLSVAIANAERQGRTQELAELLREKSALLRKLDTR